MVSASRQRKATLWALTHKTFHLSLSHSLLNSLNKDQILFDILTFSIDIKMNSKLLKPGKEPDYNVPDNANEDDGVNREPILKPESVVNESHAVWRGTQENQLFVETVLRKLNYNNFEDILFSADVKLFTFVNKSWKEQGVGSLKITRQLEMGPRRGSVRLVVYQQGSLATLVTHPIDDDMMAAPFVGRSKAAVWSSNTSSVVSGGERYAVVFTSENGASLVREFIDKFETGRNMTVDCKLGIERGENLRVTHRSSLVLNYNSDIRPHVQKKRRISVD